MIYSMSRWTAIAACCLWWLAACGGPADRAPDAVATEGGHGLGDAAYLTQLGLIRGHLKVGMSLYRGGESALAKTHMKHPEDELYSALVGEFAERGASGFADELERLADAVEGESSQGDAQQAYEALLRRIDEAERLGGTANGALDAAVIRGLLTTAAEEYAIGVRNGTVVDAHEYQDAWGFTQVALERARLASAANPDVAEWTALVEQLESLTPLWPDLAQSGPVNGDAARFEPVLAVLSDW